MTTENRHEERYNLQLLVEFDQGEGVTRDVSASGVYFTTDQALETGTKIRFFLVTEGEEFNRIYCEGKVMRAEPCDEHWGIAVRNTEFRFQRHP
ncbi:MAG: PilZ domain-containing protein [Pseudomonadota bacterium]